MHQQLSRYRKLSMCGVWTYSRVPSGTNEVSLYMPGFFAFVRRIVESQSTFAPEVQQKCQSRTCTYRQGKKDPKGFQVGGWKIFGNVLAEQNSKRTRILCRDIITNTGGGERVMVRIFARAFSRRRIRKEISVWRHTCRRALPRSHPQERVRLLRIGLDWIGLTCEHDAGNI